MLASAWIRSLSTLALRRELLARFRSASWRSASRAQARGRDRKGHAQGIADSTSFRLDRLLVDVSG